MANFENDLNIFQASNEDWQKLLSLKEQFSQNYHNLQEIIKNGYISIKPELAKNEIDSLVVQFNKNEINRFFIKNTTDIDLLYKFKKNLADILATFALLTDFKENNLALKPIHFIFSFVNNAQEIEQLIAKYNLNIADKANNGSVAMHFASQQGNKEGLELLINKYQADINIKNDFGLTPLHFIVTGGYTQSLKILLEHSKVAINIQNNQGNTALHFAAFYGWPKIVEELILKKADYNTNDNSQLDALDYAARMGNLEIFKILFLHFQKQSSFDINAPSNGKVSLLEHAIQGSNKLMVESLIKDFKVDIDQRIQNLLYPLLGAIFKGDQPMVKCLFEHGCIPLEFYITNNPYWVSAVQVINNSPSPITVAFSLFESRCRPTPIKNTSEFIAIPGNEWHIIDFINNWHKFTPSLN